MPEITIIGGRLSPFVEKVCSAAEYKKIQHTFQDLVNPRELTRINPVTGKMPVMRVDDETIYDSTFILRKLDELQPDPPLLSDDAPVAGAQRQLEDWSDESLYWHVMALRWCKENEQKTVVQMSELLPGLLRPLAGPLLRRLIGRGPRVQGLGRLPYDVLIRETGERLDDLVLLLAKRTFFYSDRPSVADFAIYGEFKTGCTEATPDFAALVSERPALADWMKRVEETTRD